VGQLLVPVIAAAIGGLIGIVGAVVGTVVKARADADANRRRERLDAYTELLKASHVVNLAFDKWGTQSSPQVSDELRDASYRALNDLNVAATRTMIVAPQAIADLAGRIGNETSERVLPAVYDRRDPSESEVEAAFDAFRDLMGQFVEAVRRDMSA
jgi:hypothetical protein